MKIKLEYIWLDGSEPQQLRSKTKIVETAFNSTEDYPMWSFDGSSTLQAKAGKGENTDCLLKPVFIVNDPFRGNPHKLVLCEVMNPDGTPHITNHRHKLSKIVSELEIPSEKSESDWFGWEQEYTLTHKPKYKFAEGEGLPLGFQTPPGGNDTPRPQGDYYCGIGSDTVVGREIVEKHMDMCMEVGLDISGINASNISS